jgi:hypothetical protein
MPVHYGGSQTTSSKKSSSSNIKGHHAGGVMKVTSKLKSATPLDHRTTVQGDKHFINTKITKGNLNTWYTKILEDVTGASVKNRASFINNYERIRSNKSYLPTKQQFSLLSLEQKQDLYQKTRRDIMRSNQNPFGETQDIHRPDIVIPKSTQGTQGTQETTGGQDISPEKKEELIARGAGTKKSSTIMTSVAGLEEEANVSQATLGGTIMRNKKKKYG